MQVALSASNDARAEVHAASEPVTTKARQELESNVGAIATTCPAYLEWEVYMLLLTVSGRQTS